MSLVVYKINTRIRQGYQKGSMHYLLKIYKILPEVSYFLQTTTIWNSFPLDKDQGNVWTLLVTFNLCFLIVALLKTAAEVYKRQFVKFYLGTNHASILLNTSIRLRWTPKPNNLSLLNRNHLGCSCIMYNIFWLNWALSQRFKMEIRFRSSTQNSLKTIIRETVPVYIKWTAVNTITAVKVSL